MIIRSTIGAAAVAAALLSAAPVSAASPMTNAFLINANQDVDFLDRSSRFALQNSQNTRLKSFAHDEARDQTLTANAFDDWIKADLASKTAHASGDQLQTGRSVALDDRAGITTRDMAAMTPPAGQEDLDSMEGLAGKDFDDAYKAKQLAALDQLQSLYGDYAAAGDDAALAAIAKRELPKIKKQIVELHRL